jgi:hypothetical protein
VYLGALLIGLRGDPDRVGARDRVANGARQDVLSTPPMMRTGRGSISCPTRRQCQRRCRSTSHELEADTQIAAGTSNRPIAHVVAIKIARTTPVNFGAARRTVAGRSAAGSLPSGGASSCDRPPAGDGGFATVAASAGGERRLPAG